jgi:dGTPase
MCEIMKEYGESFEHNEQSRRVVEFLEEKKPDYRGLNLSFEVRDGLIKHRTSFDSPPDSGDSHMSSLEAQIVNVADEIAYLNHDIDDGLRSGILKIEDLDSLAIWQKAREGVDANLSEPFFISAMISRLISLMVTDLAENTDRLIEESGVRSVEDVYNAKKELSCFSEDFQKDCKELKDFLYNNFYLSPQVDGVNKKRQEVIWFLFKKMMEDISLLPEKIRQNTHEEENYILVKDYIAGMTDQFALTLYDKLK